MAIREGISWLSQKNIYLDPTTLVYIYILKYSIRRVCTGNTSFAIFTEIYLIETLFFFRGENKLELCA